MLDEASVGLYHDQGYLFPFRAFSTERAAAYRADVERTCAESPGSAEAAVVNPITSATAAAVTYPRASRIFHMDSPSARSP